MLLPVTKITNKGNAYSVTVSANQLVEGEKGSYSQEFTLELPKTPLSQERCLYVLQGARRGHSQTTGNFCIRADVPADELQLEQSATSYVPEEFSGSLTSQWMAKIIPSTTWQNHSLQPVKNAIQQPDL